VPVPSSEWQNKRCKSRETAADIQTSFGNVRFWGFVPQLNFINGIDRQPEPNRAIEIKNLFDCASTALNSGRLFDPPF
jgi:hypothetical protein